MAAAHTALTGSDPAKDASVAVTPTAITLTFTEDINPAFANVVVNSPDGRNLVSGPPRVEGPSITADVKQDRPEAGMYTVAYRVVSADGHPVSGSYGFTVVGAPGVSPPPSTLATSAPSVASAPPESSGPLGSDSKTSVLLAAAAGLTLGGVIVFWQSRKRRGRDD
ncbi:MAG: copper resistance protein CopC [Mycolicibacterium sp.]|nr:copper resistance protein CopC [Mycolicibacterium sp.]